MELSTTNTFNGIIILIAVGFAIWAVTVSPVTAELHKISAGEIAKVHAWGFTGYLSDGDLKNIDGKTVDRSMKLSDQVMTRMMENARGQPSIKTDHAKRLKTATSGWISWRRWLS